MSANLAPAPTAPMAPLQSNTIKILLCVGAGQILLLIAPMLQAHKFDLWALGSAAIPVVAGLLFRLAGSDVVAPPGLGFLNKAP